MTRGAGATAGTAFAVAALAYFSGASATATSAASPSTRVLTIAVPGVPGPYCMYGVEKRLLELPGVARVELLWEEEKIRVIPAAGATLTSAMIRGAVEKAEYPSGYAIE